ncbi:bifunctional RNase H/acid phosphatase [Streptomyces actinomycinicus]|uniref:Bifunctional RNase H/acid phosphatase n=1 Tax=Streptomyces actinomycinicus TaxID=1695166 RepID=A0A937EDP6_9ACTN|nr:bifunctional RNase H/acid phosphatase [Streptomyces actinomycinicus]MBL1081022.1 bifunctional RNase H/acid phosphatase [Streptomyces actinomycinicus]
MREFIVEADGGSRGNPGPAGYGAVVRDAATGQTLTETAEYIGVATNNVAEYRGLLAGLRAAHALDASASVHVRMDSKLVVEQMSGRWKIKHPGMKPLAAQARSVFPPDQVTYEWIPRSENKHADRLANEAMDAGAKGGQWSASASRAELDAPPAVPQPSGPPGDATAGAAKARAALAEGRAAAAPGPAAAPAAAPAQEAAPAEQRPGWSAAPDLGAPATFVLLRHGETPLTPQKRFSGSGGTDPSLSDAGREQARRVAEALARRGTIEAVVASPLARTRETAAIVAGRLGLDVTVDDGLRETDFGAWEGLTFGEVRDRYPADLNAWLADPEAHPTGGGESFAETATRLAATRDKLVAAHAGHTVLLVTHVTPIKTLVRLALGAPPKSLFRMELSAASLSAVAYYADGNASVRLFNDTSHLRP